MREGKIGDLDNKNHLDVGARLESLASLAADGGAAVVATCNNTHMAPVGALIIPGNEVKAMRKLAKDGPKGQARARSTPRPDVLR